MISLLVTSKASDDKSALIGESRAFATLLGYRQTRGFGRPDLRVKSFRHFTRLRHFTTLLLASQELSVDPWLRHFTRKKRFLWYHFPQRQNNGNIPICQLFGGQGKHKINRHARCLCNWRCNVKCYSGSVSWLFANYGTDITRSSLPFPF